MDVFPTTGREPLRLELFGDEIESMRVLAVHAAHAPPGRERRDLSGCRAPCRPGPANAPGRRPAGPGRPRAAADPPSRPRLAAGRSAGRSGRKRSSRRSNSTAPPSSIPSRPDSRSLSRRSGRRSPPAASPRRNRSSRRSSRGGLRTIVAFAHRGEALRNQNLLRRVDARLLEEGEASRRSRAPLRGLAGPPRLRLARPRPRAPAGHAGLPAQAAPRRAQGRPALQSFADLRTGDHVVHEDHGVGKLLGFETKEVAGVTRDYLLLAFRGDDGLYVPHEQLGKVSRYIGANGGAPALSKLGGKAWQLLKSRAREGIRELAGELRLYAERQQASGVAYDLEHEYLEQLESSFPYQETDDQRVAIEAVKEDLETPRPMDRLVCGDVGFGKTESPSVLPSQSR